MRLSSAYDQVHRWTPQLNSTEPKLVVTPFAIGQGQWWNGFHHLTPLARPVVGGIDRSDPFDTKRHWPLPIDPGQMRQTLCKATR